MPLFCLARARNLSRFDEALERASASEGRSNPRRRDGNIVAEKGRRGSSRRSSTAPDAVLAGRYVFARASTTAQQGRHGCKRAWETLS